MNGSGQEIVKLFLRKPLPHEKDAFNLYFDGRPLSHFVYSYCCSLGSELFLKGFDPGFVDSAYLNERIDSFPGGC